MSVVFRADTDLRWGSTLQCAGALGGRCIRVGLHKQPSAHENSQISSAIGATAIPSSLLNADERCWGQCGAAALVGGLA